MIFITTGTQKPFDRLIKTVDCLSPLLSEYEIIAQVANSSYKAKNIKTFRWFNPKEFLYHFTSASLIISHAGMGTIISALVYEKPIIVLPRLAKLGEHRNDHQLATAKKFESLNYVHVVYNEAEIQNKIQEVLNSNLHPLYKVGNYASNELLSFVKDFIYSY